MSNEILAAVEKLKASRTEESTTDQTEVGAVDVSEDTPELEAEEVALEVEESEELSEEVSDVQVSESGEDQDTLIYEINGKEYTQEQLTEALEGNMRLSDYTRKTQEVAENRKSVAAKAEKQDQLLDTLQSHIDLLADMTDAEFKDIDWDELRDDNASEYLKLKEKKESKQGKLDKAKSDRQQMLDDKRKDLAGAESAKLFDAMGWNDNPTRQQEDLDQIQAYLKQAGWTNEEFSDIINHKHMLTILDAAKYHELKSKAPATTKKVKRAPVVVKGKKASTTTIGRQIQEAQARAKSSGSLKDAQALMKLKRQNR